MLSGFTYGSELRRFGRSRMGKVALIVIVLMPLLYSTVYLWAFWNPFGRVDHLPIALVNSDTGAVVDGQTVHAGDQVAQGLHDNPALTWTDVSAQEAYAGVRDGTYYFALEIPANFSTAVASPLTDHPEKAQLKATYNDANGYLSSMIGQSAMRTLLATVSDELGAAAVDQVLVGVVDAGTGLRRAADGAGQLATGAGDLSTGLDQLASGATTLHTGLGTAADGAHSLATGAQRLDTATTELATGAAQLAAGTDQLNATVNEAAATLTGAGALRDGVVAAGGTAASVNAVIQQLTTDASQVTANQSQQSQSLRDLAAQIQQLPDPTAAQLATQLDGFAAQLDATGLGATSPLTQQLETLATDSAQLTYQLTDPQAPLRGGVDELAAGGARLPGQLGDLQDAIGQINTGAQAVSTGAAQISTGAGELSTGAQSLASGVDQLANGSGQLADGATRAAQGSQQLTTGAEELSQSLAAGASQVPNWDEAQRLSTAQVIGGPVELTSDNAAGTNGFGGGMAPFFFSLALFIGGIIIHLLLRPIQQRAIASGVAPLRAALDGLLPLGTMGAGQAVVMIAVTTVAVGLRPAHLIGVTLFAILVSLAFVAMNQMLNCLLGPGPGKVLAMALLMVMLISSGGLYPTETEPAVLGWIRPLNPMYYSVTGFRQLIYGTFDHRFALALIALTVTTVLCVALTAIAARRHRSFTLERLHPPISL